MESPLRPAAVNRLVVGSSPCVAGDPGTNTNSFSYDPLRRLTAETGLGATRSYQYDLDGNRTRKVEGATTIDYTYDRTDQLIKQRISGVDTVASYDAYGDLTQSGTSISAVTTYGYDTASHLKSINGPGAAPAVTFGFDALGRFATRSLAGSLDSTYGYLGASKTLVSLVGSSSTRVSALGADGSRLAVKDGSTTGYLLPDLHGNVIAAEASASTAIVNALRYDGYGQTAATYAAGSGALAMDVKYGGRLDVSASSEPLYDLGARFYAPGVGAFTTLDSVLGSAQDPLSMNRFLYAEANPTTLIDPTGHKACEFDDCRESGRNDICTDNGTCKESAAHQPSAGKNDIPKRKPGPPNTTPTDNTNKTTPMIDLTNWKKDLNDRNTPAWLKDLGKVDARGCLVAVTAWCSKPASLKDILTLTVVVAGVVLVVVLAAPLAIEAGMTAGAVYATSGATGVAGLAASELAEGRRDHRPGRGRLE